MTCIHTIIMTLRILALDLNKVKTALAQRSAILGRIGEANEIETTKLIEEENIWGEGVKIIRKCTPNRKPFTSAEKADIAEKYKSGMTKTAIADFYGCHPSTVSRILGRKGMT